MTMARRLPAICLALSLTMAPAAAQVSDLEQAALGGDVDAQMALAMALDAGDGVPQDFTAALHWFRMAAEAGNPWAQNRLGLYLRSGLGTAPDLDEALIWLSRAADAGHPQFLFNLAEMYEAGAGNDPDPARAAELFGQAAAGGHADAAVSLGVMYQQGQGVAQDFARAHGLYLGPAEAGNARAQNNLGLMYTRGEGVTQDYAEAARWFTLAAGQGLPVAMTNLGRMYENGFGVEMDEARAADLYRRAAGDATGHLMALSALADPFLMLKPDDPDVMKRLQQGAQAGDPLASTMLAQILVSRPEGERPYQTVAALYHEAAQRGMAGAMANLGLLYAQGNGVPQDYVLSSMWLSLAAAAGHPAAPALRDVLTGMMTPEQVYEAQTMATEQRARQQD